MFYTYNVGLSKKLSNLITKKLNLLKVNTLLKVKNQNQPLLHTFLKGDKNRVSSSI